MLARTDKGSQGRRRSKLETACAAGVGLYALAMGFLVLAIYREDGSVNLALAVICVVGLTVAALVALRVRWSSWLAVAYSVITTIVDAPHQLAELTRPTGHAPASAVILLLGLAAIGISLLSALRSGVRGSRKPGRDRLAASEDVG